MKQITLLILSFLFIACTAQQKDNFTTEALEAPIFTSSGDEITFKELIDSYKGTPILIDVWASWCPDCIKGLPKVKELQKKYNNISYVFVSLDKNKDAWKKGIKRFSIKGNHYYTEGAWKSIFAKNIDLDWIPRYIIIDPTGKLVLYKAVKADDKKIINLLEKLN